MFSHPELGSNPPIGSDRETGCDIKDVSRSPRRPESVSSSASRPPGQGPAHHHAAELSATWRT